MFVILVRHAERLSSGDDPGLSAAGNRRADLLTAMFADANVSAIFTSRFRRTKDTAAPLAQKTGLTPQVIADDTAQAATEILGGGSCVVVIGALGGPADIDIQDDQFDRLFVLSVATAGPASLLQMHYVSV